MSVRGRINHFLMIFVAKQEPSCRPEGRKWRIVCCALSAWQWRSFSATFRDKWSRVSFDIFLFFFPVLAAISVRWQPDKQSAMFAAEQQTTRVESLSKVIHQFPFQTSRVTTRNNTAKHTKRLISLPCRSRTAPFPPPPSICSSLATSRHLHFGARLFWLSEPLSLAENCRRYGIK